jgi:hypothetical protein
MRYGTKFEPTPDSLQVRAGPSLPVSRSDSESESSLPPDRRVTAYDSEQRHTTQIALPPGLLYFVIVSLCTQSRSQPSAELT